jgi:DNA-binding transcriptional LysR family regulator
MDVKRLIYFCTIVEQGQISRAARALNISQPPLSQRLKELEDELGVQLILREGHTWQVTESGRVLYERARMVLDSLTEIPAEVKNAADGYSGRVAIGISTTCMSKFMAIVPTLAQRFPRLQVRLYVSDSTSLERHIKTRDLDFAVLLLPTREDSFTLRLLPADNFSVVFQEGLAPRVPALAIRIEDLRDVPLLLTRRWEGGGTYEHLVKTFQKQGIAPRILMDSPDIRVLLNSLEAGMVGAALLPSAEIPQRVRDRFKVLPLDLPGMAVQPALIHLKDRFLTSAARAVIAAILQEHPAISPGDADHT